MESQSAGIHFPPRANSCGGHQPRAAAKQPHQLPYPNALGDHRPCSTCRNQATKHRTPQYTAHKQLLRAAIWREGREREKNSVNIGNFFEILPRFLIFAWRIMEYKCIISPKMRAVTDTLKGAFVGMDHCITDTGKNLIVEVPKALCEKVRTVLKQNFLDVALIRNAYQMIDDLHDFILVKPLISEAPVFDDHGVYVPDLEKLLVDIDADKEYASLTDNEIQVRFQRAFELYPVNTSRLIRYAGRKGKKEEIRSRVERIDRDRVIVVHAIQDYLRQEPVERAWIFGSFSRMEEKPDSDVDLLVELDKSAPIGLLQFAGMINKLETILGRKVDLIEKDSVKPFAQKSINRDKVLIYERA